MMAVWSEVDFVDLFEGLDLAAEHYHPKKLEYIELLSRAGGDPVSSIATTVREVVTPSNAVATFDLAAAKSHVVQIDDAQPQARISAKKVAIARDVIVSRLRSYLKQVAVVPPGLGNIHLSTEFIVLRSLSDQNIAFLVPYILSAPIQVILHWSQDGNEHPRFNESVLLSLPVPPSIVNLSTELNRSLATCTDLISQSKSLYAEAEGMLSWALGLDGLDLEGRLYYERPYADLEAAARFDAEYFQPPKKAVLDALAKMPGEPVSAQFRSVRQLWQPDKANPAEPVRNYDLTDALQPFLDGTTEPVTPDAISSTKKRLKKGDLVVSRLRSYLKEIAVVQDNGPVPMVGSTEFIVLRPEKGALAVEALLVYLRSRPVQTILKWSQDGSNHPRFDERELLNLRIPDAVREYEAAIALKVRESFAARREARRLLDEAKRMVEEAILGKGESR